MSQRICKNRYNRTGPPSASGRAHRPPDRSPGSPPARRKRACPTQREQPPPTALTRSAYAGAIQHQRKLVPAALVITSTKAAALEPVSLASALHLGTKGGRLASWRLPHDVRVAVIKAAAASRPSRDSTYPTRTGYVLPHLFLRRPPPLPSNSSRRRPSSAERCKFCRRSAAAPAQPTASAAAPRSAGGAGPLFRQPINQTAALPAPRYLFPLSPYGR